MLMEVNGHLWGSLALASACGAEFAWEAYRRQVLGHADAAPPPRAGLAARDIVKETRRLVRLFRDGGTTRDPCFRPTPWRDLARYLLGFADPRIRPYVFAWRDPVPSLWGLRVMLARALAKLGLRSRTGRGLSTKCKGS
jgi:hypothetical protein